MTPTVLIVEDERVLAEAMSHYLARHGFEPAMAGSGEAALDRIHQAEPDLIVLDYQLPGMNGLEVLRAARQRAPQAAVVMLTAHGNIKTAVEPGLFEAADGGTLFLDEIGAMPLELQVKLLKAIEDRSVRRLGGLRQKEVDVRIVAATNGDLDHAAQEGTFRSDLLYRLKVLTLVLAPLRERPEDVVPLARHFLAEAARRYRRPRRLTSEAEACLRAYPWPGNVREVANVIERAVLLHEGEEIGVEVLGLPSVGRAGAPVEVGGGGGVKVDFSQGGVSLSDLERTLIVEAIKAAGGNRRRAAELLGISLETLRYRMEKHALAAGEHEPR